MKLKTCSLFLLSFALAVSALEAAPTTSRTTVKPKAAGPFAFLFAPQNSASVSTRTPMRRSRTPLFSASSRTSKNTSYSRPQPRGIVNWMALERSNRSSNHVVVDIGKQRAYLLDSSGTILINTPISSGTASNPSPRGAFGISERVRSGKVSTIYGVSMPFWMRLGGSVFGLHAGYLPGFPASHGCVRLPYDMAQLIYEHTTYGTRVNIYSSWIRS